MKAFLVVLICLALAAGCSGAGGGVAGGVSAGGGSEEGGIDEGGTEGGGAGGTTTAPVANAGEDQVVRVNTPAFLDGGESRHAAGYQWTLTNKPYGSNAILAREDQPDPSFIPDRSGWYAVQLVVDNDAGTSEPDAVMILAVLDDFERDDGERLSFSPEWLKFEGDQAADEVGEFEIFDNFAIPTGNGKNLNLWSAPFAQNQEAFFTIKAKPTDANTSSLGVFLRADGDAETGYLVTFVPQSGLNDDTIRVWKVSESTGVKICEFSYEFYADDQIWVRIVDNAIRVFVDSYAIIDFDHPIGTCLDHVSPYIREGYIGLYAAKDSGALDDFGGGEIGP